MLKQEIIKLFLLIFVFSNLLIEDWQQTFVKFWTQRFVFIIISTRH